LWANSHTLRAWLEKGMSGTVDINGFLSQSIFSITRLTNK
jgi:hypothetical protein